MNIYDISKKTGVSIATVSRVINGSSNVSEKTRAKVLAAIEESGYTPNVFARGLGLNTMKTIGIMCADSSDPYLAQAVYYIEQGLRKNNYDSLLSCTGYDHDTKENCLRLLISKRVDAVILVGSNYVETEEKNEYIRTAAQTVPIMIVNGEITAPNIYCTLCDDYSAIYEVTENFIKSGKKDILYLYNSLSYSGTKKLEGFRAAMKANGLSVKENRLRFIESHNMSVHETEKAFGEIVKNGNMPEGIVASDDVLAISALKYAKSAGISVPDELFVAGFNNFVISECCDPELTSVDNKLESLCQHCVSTLMSVFAEDKSVPKKTIFSAEIIERETTKFIK